MTDEELDSFESTCKITLDGVYGHNSKLFLELIAMIRQARRERDWLLSFFDKVCPPPQYRNDQDCRDIDFQMSCEDCWRGAASEAAKEAADD